MPKDSIARERINALKQSIKALALRLTEQVAANREANRIALDAAKEAVQKAEDATEKRLAGLNELRGAMQDQQKDFARRDAVEERFKALEDTVKRLENQGSTNAGKGQGADYLWRIALGVVAVLILVATFYRSVNP